MVKFKDTLSVILLLASLWGTSFSSVHSWAWKQSMSNVSMSFLYSLFRYRNFIIYYCIDLFFERFRWERIWSWKKWTSSIFLQFRMEKKKEKADRHSLRISNEYSVHDQFSTEMIKNTNIHAHKKTLSRPTLCRWEQTQYYTNFNSSHAGRTLTTHMDSACVTLEWHASPYVLETASALTRVESLNKKADRCVHNCDYKNMSKCDRTTKWWSFCVIRWTFEIERL